MPTSVAERLRVAIREASGPSEGKLDLRVLHNACTSVLGGGTQASRQDFAELFVPANTVRIVEALELAVELLDGLDLGLHPEQRIASLTLPEYGLVKSWQTIRKDLLP